MTKKSLRFDYISIFLAIVALTLIGISWKRGGFEMATSGLRSGGILLLRTIPLLIAAFLTAGLIQALVKKETVERWLGAKSGWRGLALACIGGALIPGGPYVYYPIAGALLQTGAGLGVLVAFVTAKNLWAISRLPVEFALLGPRITLVRFLATMLVPPILGIIAEALFGNHIQRIREATTKTERRNP
ncbi:MAG: permease [Chloroflexota bacterium]|nr:permease [Chloroflexota bacterium]